MQKSYAGWNEDYLYGDIYNHARKDFYKNSSHATFNRHNMTSDNMKYAGRFPTKV